MSIQPTKHPRKLLFVHPHFQGWFIARVTALLVAMSLVSSLGIYWLADDFVATTRRAAQVGALHWWGKFGPILLGTNVATLLVGAVVTAYVVLYASHKVVGPLIRVRRVLEELGEGRLHREIRLREGDEIAETAEAILAMEKQLAERIEGVRTCVQQLEAGEQDGMVKLKIAVERLPSYASARSEVSPGREKPAG